MQDCSEIPQISTGTIQKYMKMEMHEALEYFTSKKRRKSQFDLAIDYILERLENNHKISAVKLHRKIVKKYPEITSKPRALRNYLKPLRKKFKNNKIRHFEPILDMIPGEQIQVDGGEILIDLWNKHSVNQKVYFMVFVLSYSRMMYVSYQTHPYNSEDFTKPHIEANTYFGGIAKEYAGLP